MWTAFVDFLNARSELEYCLAGLCLIGWCGFLLAASGARRLEAWCEHWQWEWAEAAQASRWWRRGYDELREELAGRIAADEARAVREVMELQQGRRATGG